MASVNKQTISIIATAVALAVGISTGIQQMTTARHDPMTGSEFALYIASQEKIDAMQFEAIKASSAVQMSLIKSLANTPTQKLLDRVTTLEVTLERVKISIAEMRMVRDKIMTLLGKLTAGNGRQ